MPDDYNNVGPGTAQDPDTSTPEVRLKIHHGDPSLAVTGSVQAPASVTPPVAPAAPAEAPAVETRPQERSGQWFSELHEDVAPFNTPEPRIPATEYVSINPVPIPRPVPRPAARPMPRPAVPPRPPAPPKPAPLPIMTGQAIGPIIRKRPSAAMRVVQPAYTPPAQAPAQAPVPPLPPAPKPQPSAPAQPAPPVVPSPQAAPAAPAVPTPQPAPQPAVPPRPAETAQPFPVAPAAAPVSNAQAAEPVAATGEPLMIYSNNTRTVWYIRRSGKVLYSAAGIGLILVLIGVYVYWKSLGSPTHIQDIPLLHLH